MKKILIALCLINVNLYASTYLAPLSNKFESSYKVETFEVVETVEGNESVSISSCLDVLNDNSSATSGNYDIGMNGTTRNVYCDMTTSGGGWTLVYYSNSGSVSRSVLAVGDWNVGNNINFSYLHSFKDVKRNGKYEFFIHDSSNVFRNIIFNQTNSYLEDPNGNNFTQTGGNFTYASSTTSWKGLALGSYGQAAMQRDCSLSMAEGNAVSWWFCLQDQDPNGYGVGPWVSSDVGAAIFVKIYQR